MAARRNGDHGIRCDVSAVGSRSGADGRADIALVLWMTGELEMRLKTIQTRLAGMNDQLNALTRRDPDHGPDADLILELNDW
ncbi:hypothetical protein LRP30_21395 [Bradyrhizobium sp. C-145]|uniref:hypothetical protein n=1 Tax=Bradyrhizobium sp. C-145 TaxID=574727 RepID=UPI00201B4E26|nr:hypothetical protein [Bradyrhizobium sp. C-145]UQR67645.1 hypothetical protein LRP30_21395 [Bradyrhizobium sp. C-145]